MPPRVLAGIPLALLACTATPPPPDPAPAPSEPVAAQQVTPPVTPPRVLSLDDKPPLKQDVTKRVFTPEELDKIGPRPKPEPPLTQAELDLLAADPKTLTKDMRVKQAYARRRKTLQNPDSPLSRQIEALRLAHERGELATPTLPNQSIQAETPP